MYRTIRRQVIGAITLALLCLPRVAAAQATRNVAVGMSFSPTDQLSSGFDKLPVGNMLLRLGQTREGWQPKYGLNWFSTELDGRVGTGTAPLGKLKVRPLMAGYGYTRKFPRSTVSANLLAGIAFTSFSMNPVGEQAYRVQLGVEPVGAAASNTFVVKPELSAWIDLTHRIGLNVNAGYMVARPEVTIRTADGTEDRRRIRADRFMLKVGIAYAIF
jgi:hypothetical protein